MRNLRREPRRVSKSLTVQYDKILYLIEDSEYSRRAIGKYIDVWHYPDGHKELRLNGVLLPYSTYDRLSEVDPVAIVDNKRLGHVLDDALFMQRSFSLWMKLTDSKSFTMLSPATDHTDSRAAPWVSSSVSVATSSFTFPRTQLTVVGENPAITSSRPVLPGMHST